MGGRREDEEDIDFNDTRKFASQSYKFAVDAVKQNLSTADSETISEPQDLHTVESNIRKILADSKTSIFTKRLLIKIIPFPRSLDTLLTQFTAAINPFDADVNILWGLIDLNIKLSYSSQDKLSRMVDWMQRLRRVVELFNECLGVCEDMNEPRYAMFDMLDGLLQMQGESVRYLRRVSADAEPASGRALDARINDYLSKMSSVIKHLNDINSYSKVNLDQRMKTLSIRHQPNAYPEETAVFPIQMIPRNRNVNFYGRQAELKNIKEFLGHEAKNLRTYTIYGRRGVGKTDLALEYAHTNPSGFDAIFWINCETSVALRQSFTDMAIALKIQGADRSGRHEENHLAAFKWLKNTKRQWLLIYDNAEEESILRGYWPVNVKGSILTTSRLYYNFTNDAHRKGSTIKPFTDAQSLKLLMKLLGPEWEEQDNKGQIKGREERAAIELLRYLGGLPLAIEQAAELIKNDAIGGPNIASTYESFKYHQNSLPPRLLGDGADTHALRALDSLWNMRFTNLSRNSLALLTVLSMLSPDGIIIDLFLPRNQKALDGKLAFCKQNISNVDPDSWATLSSVITPPPLLQDAVDELVSFKLLKQEGRELWAHRVVQEAMIYHISHSSQDLQEYFDSAVALVYEAFPKQVHGDYLSGQWGACEKYIPHGAHLSVQFDGFNGAGGVKSKLQGSSKFIDLLSNCAWYSYEIGDYNLCISLADTARVACEDKESLQYATLCNIAGGAYFELNQLRECRINWETFLRIQETKLPEDHLELSIPYHNMGNLETADSIATENLDKAMEYFNRAIAIRIEGGDEAATLLANSYLCLSRVYFLRKDYSGARKKVSEAEALFFRTSGGEAHFMAHVHYAKGNIDFDQQEWAAAKRAYEACLRIGLASAPNHPITAAAYYSLGCVEYEQRHMVNARAYLDKAMAIAQHRSPDEVDGTIARIMWKMSEVLELDTFGHLQDDATDYRLQAESALTRLNEAGQGGLVQVLDEEGMPDKAEIELAYDSLVPGFFR